MTSLNYSIQTKRYASVKLVAELYPAFREASIRWLIFHEHTNRFDHCVKRIGRKVLIDLDQFENYIDTEGEASNNE